MSEQYQEPAFPTDATEKYKPFSEQRIDPEANMPYRVVHWPGLSVRDYFAAAALTGQLTCMGNQADPDKRAVEAYKFADAMLKARATP